MKKLGVLTGGGDAPGLNAVIRAVVKTAIRSYDCEVIGFRDGFDGFLNPNGGIPLGREEVRGILPRGGTILGTANRGNPFAREVMRDGKIVVEDISDEVVAAIEKQKLDGLIVIGGDGTLHIGKELFKKGVPVIGVPKTIDNDVGGTEVTFGFDTALETATEAIDKLHTTAESHHRVMVLELMGRDAGFIALHAGVAGGADVILIPEIPFSYESVVKKILRRVEVGRPFSILAVSEGAKPIDGKPIFSRGGNEIYVPRLGGIAQQVGQYVEENTEQETRVTVLGHIQRGGSPTPFDRWLATRYGAAATRLAAEGGFGKMVALRYGEVVDISLAEALDVPKRVNIKGDAVRTARNLGICLGDDEW
ncbi:MAG: ATP-dependent 6-phosphofructokinase [Anaerolineae bacterium]|jgi:ATP-dependent phosphofructokinase / diphosphate-dependent phosphofructokinase|nr:ATP-dependent 6-phosphofructokinase [Anaerolineae bacterium]MBT7325321.1 ATP-dependent 6-phosphofructokinase [Anaerolineae bacterium]